MRRTLIGLLGWMLLASFQPALAQAPELHLHLVWEGTGDPMDPCHTGDQVRSTTIDQGPDPSLIACLRDGSEAAISTINEATFLSWEIRPAEGGEIAGTRFSGQPETETGSDGTARATVEAFRSSKDQIVARLCTTPDSCGSIAEQPEAVAEHWVTHADGEPQCNDEIDNDADGRIDFPDDSGCDSTTDNDEAGLTGDPNCAFNGSGCEAMTIDYRQHAFRGALPDPEDKCIDHRRVAVRKVRRGRDDIVGFDRTDYSGRWNLASPYRAGRYYAKIRTIELRNGDICQGMRSTTIKLEPR